MQKRYPLTVLNLSLPLEEVDPNIHPRKSEVRFIFEDKVFSSIYSAIRQSLGSKLDVSNTFEVADNQRYDLSSPYTDFENQQTALQMHGELETKQANPMISPSSYEVLGQIEQTYIVARSSGGLVLIDQHAAHERVLYEELMTQLSEKVIVTQYLLEPDVLTLSENLLDILNNDMELLASYGYDLNVFGENTVLLRGVPSVSSKSDYKAVFRELLRELALTKARENLNHRAVALIACHSSIRAGEVLNEDVMKQLIVQLRGVPRFETCPHGRPTMLNISKHQLDKEFHRI